MFTNNNNRKKGINFIFPMCVLGSVYRSLCVCIYIYIYIQLVKGGKRKLRSIQNSFKREKSTYSVNCLQVIVDGCDGI